MERTFSRIMKWNRSKTLALASNACCYCQGTGMRLVYRNHYAPCGCVFRAIFRICIGRFRECAINEGFAGSVSWEFCGGSRGFRVYSRKREEYMADFQLIAKRVLTAGEYQIFRYYFLLGADWRLCMRQLKIERGVLFHWIYRIERKLGQAFAETVPYGIYPLDEYFSGVSKDEPAKANQPASRSRRQHLQFPYRKAA
jgi:hypothetical protein